MSLMKAAVFSRYGRPHVVPIKDVEKPVPKDVEASIELRAASVNRLDRQSMRGSPYIARTMGGLHKPKDTRLGATRSISRFSTDSNRDWRGEMETPIYMAY